MKARILKGLGLLALAAVAGSFFVVWLTRPTHRIGREAFGHIKQGMTKDQVESILGCPSGNYASTAIARTVEGTLTPIDELEAWFDLITPFTHMWSGDDGAILIHFREDDTVRAMVFWEVVPEGFLPSLRRWVSRVACCGQ
jgi:hypothetical protein